jgi:hypothetical protein
VGIFITKLKGKDMFKVDGQARYKEDYQKKMVKKWEYLSQG